MGHPELVLGGGGDIIILKVQRIPVTAATDVVKIREALSKTAADQEVSVTVLRSGRVVELKGRRPK